MTLCIVCQSIPFDNLPEFPSDAFNASCSGKKYIHNFVRRRGTEPVGPVFRSVRHHESYNALKAAVERGCELCALIKESADAVCADIEAAEDERYAQPTFDMWLCQPQKGRQGFWVFSENASKYAEVPLLAAFMFVVPDEDDPLATTIHGRLVTPIPDEQVLQRVVAWNKESEDDENQVQAIATVPQYLIDVQASDSGDAVKLVEANGDSPLRYTALSYASEAGIGNYWESSGLTRDDRIPVEKLSKLLQDAILVTRTLGIPYLWIDSLCIPGDVKDWDRSSEKAGAVHENAYLTISATGTERVSDGLLFARPARATVRIPYGWSEGGARRSVLASPVPLIKDFLRDLYIKMEHEPISKGVWSFQDRALSRRTVHFASDQIYLESMRRFMSEDGYIENHRYHSTANNLPEGTEHYLVRALDDKLPYSRWCAIVYEYGRRKAGKSSDKLLAISNVARRYAALSEDKYIAGHWKKPLLESLAWYAMSCSPSNYPNAPSWSWVSVDGAAALALGYSVLEKEISKVKNTQVILKDETNPFGDVTAASIEIEGPLVPMHLIDKKDDCFGRSIWLQADGREDELLGNLDTMDKNCSASAEALHQMGIFVLALFETRRDKSAPPKPCSAGTGTLRCIIVTPVEGSDNKMKRIGFLSAPVTNLDYDKPEWRKTVVLV